MESSTRPLSGVFEYMICKILFIFSTVLSVLLLYKYVPIWFMYRKEAQIDKKTAAEIDAISDDEELPADQFDLVDLLPTAEELNDLLDD